MSKQPARFKDESVSESEPLRRYHTSNDLYPTPRPKSLPQGVYYLHHPDSPGPRILRAMHVWEKDLDVNRDGYLSPTQRRRLLRKNTEWVVICFVGTTLATWLPVQSLSASGFACMSWLWVMLIWGIFLWEFSKQTRLYRALLRGRVESMRGQIRLLVDERQFLTSITDVVMIGETSFAIRREVARGFVTNEDYTLYFLPGVDHLVSAEHHPVTYQSTDQDA